MKKIIKMINNNYLNKYKYTNNNIHKLGNSWFNSETNFNKTNNLNII